MVQRNAEFVKRGSLRVPETKDDGVSWCLPLYTAVMCFGPVAHVGQLSGLFIGASSRAVHFEMTKGTSPWC